MKKSAKGLYSREGIYYSCNANKQDNYECVVGKACKALGVKSKKNKRVCLFKPGRGALITAQKWRWFQLDFGWFCKVNTYQYREISNWSWVRLWERRFSQGLSSYLIKPTWYNLCSHLVIPLPLLFILPSILHLNLWARALRVTFTVHTISCSHHWN